MRQAPPREEAAKPLSSPMWLAVSTTLGNSELPLLVQQEKPFLTGVCVPLTVLGARLGGTVQTKQALRPHRYAREFTCKPPIQILGARFGPLADDRLVRRDD